MTKEEKEYILDKIENEGFDYCYRFYSSFKEIKDEEFHKLRLQYISAAKELENYLKK